MKFGNLAGAVAAAALFLAALYYLAGATVRSDGGFAAVQPDTLLYCQAARRICEGAPFSFSAGSAPCTGTTSVLHPFLLALPYALGCRGDALLRAGFVLNALFFLLFAAGWTLVAWRYFEDRPRVRPLAAFLAVFSGSAAYAAFAQSDIGLWLAASALLTAGLACGRCGLYGPLLLIVPWIRPEGMVCVVAFCLALVVRRLFLRARSVPADRVFAALGVLSACGVFAFNAALTGRMQFASVSGKGYFATLPFVQAVVSTAGDLLVLVRDVFLGCAQGLPRALYAVPVLGGLLVVTGLAREFAVRPSDCPPVRPFLRFFLLFAVAGGVFTVASSGWRDANMDRYLAWIFPVLALLTASGADTAAAFAERHSARTVFPAACGALALFALAASVVFPCAMRYQAEKSDRLRSFAAECEKTMEPGAAVGAWGLCGVAYEFSSRRLAHLSGIYSPEFATKTAVGALEVLKREPAARFGYWMFNAAEDAAGVDGRPDAALGPLVLAGPDRLELRRANWGAFDAAARDPRPAEGFVLKARVDVGYEADERAAAYETVERYDLPPFAPFTAVAPRASDGAMLVDGGRVLWGGDAMTVPLEPGRDVRVTMRTLPSRRALPARSMNRTPVPFAFRSPMSLQVFVDGVDAGVVSFPIAETGFTDAVFTIPGSAVKRTSARIAFLGEHIACGYWFWQ